jgi:hypothetical protein
MQRLEVSGALRHIYMCVCVCVCVSLGGVFDCYDENEGDWYLNYVLDV